MLPLAEIHRSPWLPEGTVLLSAPGALRPVLPPIFQGPVTVVAPDTLRWRPAISRDVLRPIDVIRLFDSVRTSRSHDRIWAEDWWHNGERRGWWEG
jgi:hypothetical protein